MSWWQRLKSGLSKSTSALSEGITAIFTKRKLDQQALDELEELLIAADLGPQLAARLVADFSKNRFGKEITATEVREALASQIAVILEPVAKPFELAPAFKPAVILMVGVNGAGKTTTIGKLALKWKREGKKVLLVAGDTFRAAAVAQLTTWAERAGVDILTGAAGADPAALAYKGFEKAKAEGFDILLIDTAGRLQNKSGLMEELAKIVRVLKKMDEAAPHATLLVLDATSGQNAHSQVKIFSEMVQVNGLIVTKLDGSARGGVLVALAQHHALPVHAIGVGEGIDDLRSFTPTEFARALMGLQE